MGEDQRTLGRAMAGVFDLLGRRWQLRVIWELRSGPATFRELQGRCDGVSPSVLAARVQELRDAGIVERVGGYRLTEAGTELLDIYPTMSQWARRWQISSGE